MQEVFVAVLHFKHKFSIPSMTAHVTDLYRYWTYLKASGICSENREKERNETRIKLSMGTVVNVGSELRDRSSYQR